MLVLLLLTPRERTHAVATAVHVCPVALNTVAAWIAGTNRARWVCWTGPGLQSSLPVGATPQHGITEGNHPLNCSVGCRSICCNCVQQAMKSCLACRAAMRNVNRQHVHAHVLPRTLVWIGQREAAWQRDRYAC